MNQSSCLNIDISKLFFGFNNNNKKNTASNLPKLWQLCLLTEAYHHFQLQQSLLSLASKERDDKNSIPKGVNMCSFTSFGILVK